MPTTLLNVGRKRGFHPVGDRISGNDGRDDSGAPDGQHYRRCLRAHVKSVGSPADRSDDFPESLMTDKNSTLLEGFAMNQYGWPVPRNRTMSDQSNNDTEL